MSESTDVKTITLKHPVTVGGITVTELNLKRLKAKHMKGIGANADPMAAAIKIVSKLSGQLEVVIDELDIEDLQEVSSYIESFIDLGLPTGKMT